MNILQRFFGKQKVEVAENQQFHKPFVSGSKQIDEKKMREFIEHWERMIYPYEETHDQKRAIKTVITELDTWLRAYCR